jgi:hypothetical protein
VFERGVRSHERPAVDLLPTDVEPIPDDVLPVVSWLHQRRHGDRVRRARRLQQRRRLLRGKDDTRRLFCRLRT